VRINESGRHDATCCIDYFGGFLLDDSDRNDPTVLDTNIGYPRW
jgi:hypothetical protein